MEDLGGKVPALTVETRGRQDVPIRSELYGGIEADGLRIDVGNQALDAGEVEVADACGDGSFPPDRSGSGGVGQELSSIDKEQRLTVDPHVSTVSKGRQQMLDVGAVILVGVCLRPQYLAVMAIPPPR